MKTISKNSKEIIINTNIQALKTEKIEGINE
jgi:hypothetical protein